MDLVTACQKYFEKKPLKVDVGCGGSFARFSTSNNVPFGIKESKIHIQSLNFILGNANTYFHSKKKINEEHCYDCFDALKVELQSIPGIGPLCAAHIIQLSSLLGLIPLQYYVYISPNFKMKGGPIRFFREYMNFDKNDMKSSYRNELKELQQIYGQNFTSNIFENASCIFGRRKKRQDILYHFPIPMKQDLSFSQETSIQLMFRVDVDVYC